MCLLSLAAHFVLSLAPPLVWVRRRREDYVETPQGTMFAHAAGLFGVSDITLVRLKSGGLNLCTNKRKIRAAVCYAALELRTIRYCCAFV